MAKLNSYLPDEAHKFGWSVVPNEAPFINSKTMMKWQDMTLSQFLRSVSIPEKELTEKQLFSKLKKELKEVVNRTSAI